MSTLFQSLLCAAALAATGAQAAVFDAAADFSATTNTDTSVWSYRTSTSAVHDGSYPLLPNFGPFAGFTGPPAGTAGWAQTGVPAIGVNTTNADQYFIGFGEGAKFTWPAGALFMHPGSNSLAVVSWRSPTAAVLSINFSFVDLDANPDPRMSDGVSWSVEKNSGAGALAAGSFANGGHSDPISLSHITVAAGDRIQFIVGNNGNHEADSTRLMATITTTPVPEPASWLLALAGGGLLLVRRRAARA